MKRSEHFKIYIQQQNRNKIQPDLEGLTSSTNINLIRRVTGKDIPSTGYKLFKDRIRRAGFAKRLADAMDELYKQERRKQAEASRNGEERVTLYNHVSDSIFDAASQFDFFYQGLANERAMWVRDGLAVVEQRKDAHRGDMQLEELQKEQEAEKRRQELAESQRQLEQASTKNTQLLPPDLNWVCNNLYKIGDVEDSKTWSIKPAEAPSTRVWSMLLWAAKNADRFWQRIMDEEIKLHAAKQREKAKGSGGNGKPAKKAEEPEPVELAEQAVEDGMGDDEWETIESGISQ